MLFKLRKNINDPSVIDATCHCQTTFGGYPVLAFTIHQDNLHDSDIWDAIEEHGEAEVELKLVEAE